MPNEAVTNDADMRAKALKLCDIVDDLIACPFPERFDLRAWVPAAGVAERELRAVIRAIDLTKPVASHD